MIPIRDLKALLEHRYPMLLIDGVEEVEFMSSCHAFKLLSLNELFFQGHFMGNPVMPGSLQIEAFTQAVAIPILYSEKPLRNMHSLMLAGVDKVRYYKTIVPGDRLEIFVKINSITMGLISASATGFVRSEKVSEGRILYSLRKE
jgi:3-hydroxymyristoyl/3-hydroxydecanoyl-(acyl carrier protein) dehydratase